MGYAFRSACLATHLPLGTIVAKPPAKHMCWGAVHEIHGRRLQLPRQCSARPQAGRITCRAHAKHEEAARELQNVLAAQEYGGVADLVGEGE
jgi:hypothetical protein